MRNRFIVDFTVRNVKCVLDYRTDKEKDDIREDFIERLKESFNGLHVTCVDDALFSQIETTIKKSQKKHFQILGIRKVEEF